MAMLEQTLALMTAIEADYVPRLASVLETGMREMAVHLRQTRLPAEPSIRHLAAVKAELMALWDEAAIGSGRIFAEAEFKSTEALTRISLDYAEAFGNQNLHSIADTTHRQVRDLITGGLTAGQAVDAVYQELFDKIPQMASLRALLITRTEVHSSSQFAMWRLALRSNLPLTGIWNAVGDDRTRDFGEMGKISVFNHRSMNGQRAALTAPFLVPRISGGYEQLMFPGDPTGSAGNIINCRCVQTFERA